MGTTLTAVLSDAPARRTSADGAVVVCRGRVARWSVLWSLFCGLLVFLDGGLNLGAQPAHENHTKATLLFNFCQFVEWPAEALTGGTNAPFVIGLVGADPFGRFLDDLIKHERAHGKPIEVRRFCRIEEVTEAHVLFVGKSAQARADSIVAQTRGKPILLVTESEERGFPPQAGMIALVREGDKIRLHVNLEAARAAGLTISAKLLRIADSVHQEKR